MAGRVNLDYRWIGQLSQSHFRSVLVALAAVWLMLAISFRSAVAGLFAVAPVLTAVLLIYAVMGLAGIWLSIGTSMFAAIAIGTGVDFAVHSLDRLTTLVKREGHSLDEAFTMMYPSTGRALVFNFAAVFLGFGLLMTSHVPPLIRFGVLITVSIAVSFLASLTVLPALLMVVKPSCLTGHRPAKPRSMTTIIAGIALIPLMLSSVATAAQGDQPVALTGDQIAQRINARDHGQAVSRTLVIEMVNRAGKKRVRQARTFRKHHDSYKRTVVFYVHPKNVKGSAFLNINYVGTARDDDRWIYLPALRKVRRISASQRGDYFFGTDFTYEDIDNETKVNVPDYRRKYIGTEKLDGRECLIMEATPLNASIAKELGYSRVVSWVDPQMWMLRKTDYWDTRGRHLKTIYFRQVRQVQDIWTAHQLEAHNHRTGHKTVLLFKDVDYKKPINDDLFTLRALRRGL